MGILDNSSRFLLVDKPLTFPFFDIVNQTPEGPLFDLGVDLEYFNGVVYVKVEHIEEMARVLGMLSKDDATVLNERIKELEAENEKLPNEVEELVNGIAGLVSRYRTGGTAGISVPPYLRDIEDATEPAGNSESESRIPEGSVDELDEILGKSDETNGQADNDSGRKGSNRVSASSGNEFGFGTAD